MARLSVSLLSFLWGRIADSLATARKALEDLEKTHAKALKERLSTEERAIKAERALRELTTRVEHGDRQSSDLEQGRQRLEEELQEERDRHAADLAERDFAMSQTQITYQSKCLFNIGLYTILIVDVTAKLAELSDGEFNNFY